MTGEVGALVTLTAPAPVLSMADLSELELRAEIDEADLAAVAVGQAAYATADAYGDRRFPVVIRRVTRELGRKTVRDDDPRARVDTRVLEVLARFDGPPGAACRSVCACCSTSTDPDASRRGGGPCPPPARPTAVPTRPRVTRAAALASVPGGGAG